MPLRLKPEAHSAKQSFTFSPSPEPSPPSSPSEAIPPAVWLPERDMKTFGAYPLTDIGGMELGRGVIRCGKCGRVGLESAVADHAKICNHLLLGTPLTAKKASKTKSALDDEGSRKRRASDVSMSPGSPSKKRSKHLPSATPVPGYPIGKKENKKEAKERQRLERKEIKEREKAEIAERKRMRTNGPLNLDRQCGVINDKGLPCMRSLTCKTHTVGAKRAVEGRTRSYDILFIEWQRINNPNFKEPAPRKDKAAREEEKRLKNRGDDPRKKIKKPKPAGPVETLGADEDESEEMEALIRATRYAGKKVHSTVRARLGGDTVTAFPAVIRRESYPRAPADANPAGCLAIWQCGRHDQLRVGQLLASALATRKANVGDDSKRGSASAAMFGNKGSGLGVQLHAVQVQG